MSEHFKVKMLSYDQVRDIANIAYLAKNGKVKSLSIHRSTFSKLMSGSLDTSDFASDKPSSFQLELREILRTEIKKDFTDWFESTANQLSMEACNGSN